MGPAPSTVRKQNPGPPAKPTLLLLRLGSKASEAAIFGVAGIWENRERPSGKAVETDAICAWNTGRGRANRIGGGGGARDGAGGCGKGNHGDAVSLNDRGNLCM